MVTSFQLCYCRSVAVVTSVCQSQWGTRWRFLTWSDLFFFYQTSGGGGASEPATCRKACWKLHPPSLSVIPPISQTSHLFSFLLALLSQTIPVCPPPPPPILPQRAVYESRWIVGNKSSTLQVFVINSVNWTSIIISLQRRDGERKVWIFFFRFKLFNQLPNLPHLLIIYWHSDFDQKLKSDKNCSKENVWLRPEKI